MFPVSVQAAWRIPWRSRHAGWHGPSLFKYSRARARDTARENPQSGFDATSMGERDQTESGQDQASRLRYGQGAILDVA